MKFKNQISPMLELQMLADSDRHNIMIEGSIGSGKSYLAKQYANMLGISNFQSVDAKVSLVKEIMDMCIGIDSPIVVSIENLDIGVAAVSYALLKFIEEPTSNVYIVITCRNIKWVPDTIVSRSAVVTVPPMIESDILDYAYEVYSSKVDTVKNTIVWKCVNSISDVDSIMQMDSVKLNYFDGVVDILNSIEPVSSIVWKLQKYSDGSITPIDLVLKCIMQQSTSTEMWKIAHECLCTVIDSRVGAHAALAKMVLQYKYAVKKG